MQEQSGGSPTANLLTGLGIDEYFSRTDAGGPRHYLTDALGSTVALSDGSGVIQTEYTFEPFGATSTSGASSSNAFGFTGRETDSTGLYYYRARYYDPRLQRFTAEDPLGLVRDANLHLYVRNSPQSYVDPTGEAWIAIVAGVLVIVELGAYIVPFFECNFTDHCDPHLGLPHTEPLGFQHCLLLHYRP